MDILSFMKAKKVEEKVGDLSTLETTEKGSLVGAVNEVDGELETHLAQSVQDSGGVHGLVYDSGDFLPELKFGGGNVGMTYTRQEGEYVLIGDLVHFKLRLEIDVKGSSTGIVSITNFPFASKTRIVFASVFGGVIYPSGASNVFARINGTNRDFVNLFSQGSEHTEVALGSSNITSSFSIDISGTYEIF